MAPKETENKASAKQTKSVIDVMAFSVVVNSRYCEKLTRSSFQSTNINFS